MGRERNESGRYADRIDPDTVLEVFVAREDPARPLTASDIVDELDIARRTAHNKLNALVERGELETRKVGARGRVWWTPMDPESVREPVETPSAETPGQPEEHPDPSPSTGTETAPAPVQAAQTSEETLRDLNLPGRGAKLDARIEAVLGLYDHLRDHAGEPVARADLLDLVDPEAVGYASKESFWNNFIKANSSQGRDANALVALPGVEQWGDGEYQYTEP